MMRMMRRSSVMVMLATVLAAGGCASTQTYRAGDERIDGEVVAEVELDAEARTLEATVDAGDNPVRGVSLRTNDGQSIPPSFSRRGPAERRGGVRLGVGSGTYGGIGAGGGVGVGVGASTRVGGRVVPGELFARWVGAPLGSQPLTLVVHLDSEPAVVVDVPLGEPLESVRNRDTRLLQEGFTKRQRWRLPSGDKELFDVRYSVDGVPLYRAVPEEDR